MLVRVNFYSLCLALGLSILLILAGNRYADNGNNQTADFRRITKGFSRAESGHDYSPQSALSTTSSDNFPLNAEKVLEKTRTKIKSELAHYNFTYSGFHKLEDLVLETGGEPLRSVIISTWRSGTTFLGEILNSLPGNFYHYEPLLNYEIIQIRGPPQAENAMNRLRNFLKCKFEDMPDYFNYFKKHWHVFSHNTRLWEHFKTKREKEELCCNPEFVSAFCKLFPFQSMKVVRVRLRLVEELLEDNELHNLKIVLLIRDPRGVMQSRQHREFCQPQPDCSQPKLLCADMISDYVASGRLLQKYPERLMVLRYEELALNPNATTQNLFKFLGLYMMPSVTEFLQSHTNNEVHGVSSTFRVSYQVPFRWRHVLKFKEVYKIQAACKEAMELWGYRMASNESHLVSKDFIPITNYTIKRVTPKIPIKFAH